MFGIEPERACVCVGKLFFQLHRVKGDIGPLATARTTLSIHQRPDPLKPVQNRVSVPCSYQKPVLIEIVAFTGFRAMFTTLGLWVGALIHLFRNRRNLALENLTLRQQLSVLKGWHPRPRLNFPRQTLLGRRSSVPVRIEASPHRRHPRNCGPLASPVRGVVLSCRSARLALLLLRWFPGSRLLRFHLPIEHGLRPALVELAIPFRNGNGSNAVADQVSDGACFV